MGVTESLVCATCGGPLPLEAARQVAACPFCGATAVPAPRVVERVVERILVASGTEPTRAGPRCPRCARLLEQVRAENKSALVCTNCGGVWLDTATVTGLSQATDAAFEVAVRRAVGVVMPMSPHTRQASISCPVCQGPARRMEIANTVHGVDVCDLHGTWFDRDELPMFVKAFVDERAGELSTADLRAAGLPGSGEDEGFFSSAFRLLFRGGG